MEQEEAVEEVKDYEETDSPVEMLLDDKELLEALVDAPHRTMDNIVKERRRNMFDSLWKQDFMPRDKVLDKVRDMEERAIDVWREENPEYELPDWLVRMEAQHIVLEGMVDMIKEDLDE